MKEPKTIDYWVGARNEVQFTAEPMGNLIADECWVRLGVANRHINRVINGALPLTPGLESEIETCVKNTGRWLKELKEHETAQRP
jgi:hypothetical protein